MRALPLSKGTRPGGRPRKSRAPTNAFASWIRATKLKSSEIAKTLGISCSAVYNLKNSYYLPGRELAVKIAEASKEAVTVESWSNVTPRKRGKVKS